MESSRLFPSLPLPSYEDLRSHYYASKIIHFSDSNVANVAKTLF